MLVSIMYECLQAGISAMDLHMALAWKLKSYAEIQWYGARPCKNRIV